MGKGVLIFLILAATYGVFFALYPYYFVHGNIEQTPNEAMTISELGSEPYAILYRTDGPIFSSVSTECYSDYNDGDCIVLKTGGKPGLVELNIPKSALLGTVSAIKVGWFHERDVKFDLISSDSDKSIVRFYMPSDQFSVRIHSGWFDAYMLPFIMINLVWPTVFVYAVIVDLRRKGLDRIRRSLRSKLGL